MDKVYCTDCIYQGLEDGVCEFTWQYVEDMKDCKDKVLDTNQGDGLC